MNAPIVDFDLPEAWQRANAAMYADKQARRAVPA